jgi:hypothetical protein
MDAQETLSAHGPSTLTDEQLDQVIELAMEQIYFLQSVTCACLVSFGHSQYAIDVSPDTFRRALQRDQKIRI